MRSSDLHSSFIVIPANAGIQSISETGSLPAQAGTAPD
jgi:hypothetical protein